MSEHAISAWSAAVPRLEPAVDVAAPDDPADAAVRLARAGLGEQYIVYEQAGTWHVAIGPGATLTLDATRIHLGASGRAWPVAIGKAPLADVARVLGALAHDDVRCYGWASFELAHVLHGDGEAAGAGPLLHLVFPFLDVEFSPGQARIRSTDREHLSRVKELIRSEEPVPAADDASLPTTSPGSFQDAVADAVHDIRARLLDKVVLSRVVALPEEPELDLFATYLAGRRANTPARSFLLDAGGWRAAGFSPETVIEADAGGAVRTRPLAGTRALGADTVENARLRDDLLRDPKEIHEHAISVRLAVHEMSTICRADSIAVEEFMTVEERGSVQHLASRVAGTLRDTETSWSALAALFPAITATGVPKPAALRAIRTREGERRGLYGGAVLMAGTDGSLDAALVLRTVFHHAGRTWLRAGAGVMEQSTPDREWEETCEKLRSVAPHLRLHRSPDRRQHVKDPL